MNLQDYVFNEDMSFDQFLDANPKADNSLAEDEDISEAVMDYYALKAMGEHDRRMESELNALENQSTEQS